MVLHPWIEDPCEVHYGALNLFQYSEFLAVEINPINKGYLFFSPFFAPKKKRGGESSHSFSLS